MKKIFQHREGEATFSPVVAIPFLLAVILLSSTVCKAQGNPVFKIDDDLTRFAYSAGGRIAYATRHVFSVKKVDLQRDDIWICEPDGKKHRILLGEKFVRGSGPFSYTVRGLRWSPDGSKLTVELATNEMINEDGDTREGVSTLLLDDSGREITIAGADSVIPGASNAAWMADGATVFYLEALPPQPRPPFSEQPPDKDPLFTITRVAVTGSKGGKGVPIFPGRKFQAVAWNAPKGTGLAIEPGSILTTGLPNSAGPPNLVAIDLMRQTSRALATLEGYAGGLVISPSGKKVAYWIDNGQLEARDVDAPNMVARLRVPLGTLAWSGDETRILVKRGAVNRSGGLVWLALPQLVSEAAEAAPATVEVAPQSVLHDLEFRQFDISPDGRSLAVVEPGRRNLVVYPLP